MKILKILTIENTSDGTEVHLRPSLTCSAQWLGDDDEGREEMAIDPGTRSMRPMSSL